jgi:hypothetical protein
MLGSSSGGFTQSGKRQEASRQEVAGFNRSLILFGCYDFWATGLLGYWATGLLGYWATGYRGY